MNFIAWWKDQYGNTGEVPERFFNMMQDAYERGVSDETEACATEIAALKYALQLDEDLIGMIQRIIGILSKRPEMPNAK